MTPDTGVEHLYWSLILRGIVGTTFCSYYYFIIIHFVRKILVKERPLQAWWDSWEVLSVLPLLLHLSLRFSQEHRVNLVAHLDGSKFEVQQRLLLLQKDLCLKDLPPTRHWRKPIRQLIIQLWNKAPCYLIWYFLVFRVLFCAVFSLYFGKTIQSGRCIINIIKNADISSDIFLFLTKTII
jgi:hypothetical protein